jgi:hypothetical protein
MKHFNRVDYDMWFEVASLCPYATYFHSPLWHRLISDTYGKMRCVSLIYVSDNGRRAVLPLIVRSTRGGTRKSTFAGCYGGIIADGPISEQEAQRLYAKAIGPTGRVQITGNPLWCCEVDNPPIPSFDTMVLKEETTHILRLDRGIDAIVSEFSKGHQRSLKRGIGMGVRVRQARSVADYVAYYEAYENTLHRWGKNASSRYPSRLFTNGYTLSVEYPQHVRLWLAELEGKVIAGAWVFYWNKHVAYWHGASYEDFFQYRPNHVLHTEIIRDASDRGFKYYDFNPSGGHEGVVRFKSQFGGEELPVYRWTSEGPLAIAARIMGS